ncbi:MAG: three-Cys-motif partner protein TcmP, partial [Armatimonadetes bacterium]|nr:three-Cys-motif partner protein TcmP [Armatimonadota bacterium]
MTTPLETRWKIQPHTRAKHEILQRYLQAWFPILNTYHQRIVYIDGFAGPGRYSGGEPGSPIIALDVAINHRETLQGELVFWFIDESKDRAEHLKQEICRMNIPPHFKIHTETGRFHEIVESVLQSIETSRVNIAPTFAFVDPFGFSGIPYSLIKRLLSYPHCEVLITFMVDAINRFLEHPNDRLSQHFSIDSREGVG